MSEVNCTRCVYYMASQKLYDNVWTTAICQNKSTLCEIQKPAVSFCLNFEDKIPFVLPKIRLIRE